jgi:hypothetical protein
MTPKGAARGLLVVGVALRVWQYAADQSFWFDELSIARNVLSRSLSDLVLKPLAYDQIAPIGYMALVKLSALLFGPSDLALRLPSFLAGILALILCWRLADETLDGVAVPIAVGLFATAIPMVRYSAELKQYMLDVAAALIMTLIALGLRRREPTVRQCVVAALTGFVLVWFSQTTVFMLAGLGLAFVWLAGVEHDAEARRPALMVVPIWAIASLAATIVSIHRVPPETLAFMHRFWTSRNGFFPATPRLSDAFWLWDRVVQFLGRGFSWYAWPGLFAAAAGVGFVVLWRQRREVALWMLGPVIVTAIAACARQYPFWNRTVLFLTPALVIAIGAAVEWGRSLAARAHRGIGALVVAPFAVIPVLTLVRIPPPYFLEGFKPVLAYVQSQRRPGDVVYVFSNAFEGVDHYGSRYGLPSGSYVLGICDERETRPFLDQVDRFRGTPRLWVIGSSVPEFQYARDAIDRYLGTIGIRRDLLAVPSPLVPQFGPVSAELFDVSDTTRLRTTTVATFQLLPPNTTGRFPVCHDWVRP